MARSRSSIEVTGTIEYAANVVLSAIEHGKHVVLMNAELDGTVGPILKTRADAAGVVLSACDGDQPGVEMNLYRFVRTIGLQPLVVGNIKGLQDRFRNPTTQQGYADQWGLGVSMVTSFADGTKVSYEQAIVANATGFRAPKRGLYGWDHREHIDTMTKRYDVDELRAMGGIVDYVVGAQPAPGIYVIGTHDDPYEQKMMALYKKGDGPLYSFYTPAAPVPLRGADFRGARGTLPRRGSGAFGRPRGRGGRDGEAAVEGGRNRRWHRALHDLWSVRQR